MNTNKSHTDPNDFFREKYNDSIDRLINNQCSVIEAYDGVINNDTISMLESRIEEKIYEYGLPKNIIKKTFFICVELLQNLFLHGAQDENRLKHNFFILAKKDNGLLITSANLIENKHVEKIRNIFETINSFKTYDELKQYYMDRLDHNDISEKGGAGLGFITIGMKSQPPLVHQFEKINDRFSYFQLNVKILINE